MESNVSGSRFDGKALSNVIDFVLTTKTNIFRLLTVDWKAEIQPFPLCSRTWKNMIFRQQTMKHGIRWYRRVIAVGYIGQTSDKYVI